MLTVSLKVLGGKHDGQLVQITTPKFLIGREDDCHLRPNSDMVSRHHCAFTVDDFGVRLRDLGSTNGTLVNGERIRGVAQLNEGDEVSIGKLRFQLLIGDAAAKAAAPKLDLSGETAEMSGADTRLDIPAATSEQTVTNADTETQQFTVPPESPAEAPPPEQPAAEPAMAPAQPAQPAAMPQQQMPQYGYPQGQYPQQPGYYPAPPQMGYPPPMGGYYPQQYPQYPYPQQQVVMGQPMPGYGAPPQQEAPMPASDESGEMPATRLPDPAMTGAKAPEAPPPPAEGDAPAAAPEKNPSDHAADIIKQHLQRRPGAE